MSKFSGTVTHGAGASYYQVVWGGYRVPLCDTPLFDMCSVGIIPHNWLSMTLDKRDDYRRELSYAWGYEGHGPALLAITLLGFYGARSWMVNTASHFSGGPEPKRGGSYDKQAAFVKKHYQAFTSEVIANLPDNWTMTMEDIDKWVKGQENKPKEK